MSGEEYLLTVSYIVMRAAVNRGMISSTTEYTGVYFFFSWSKNIIIKTQIITNLVYIYIISSG